MVTEIDGDAAPDWALVILEVQTDPAGMACPTFGQLFELLYDYIEAIARVWVRRRGVHDDAVEELAAAGWDKVVSKIQKFTAPSDNSEEVRKAFKAWVGTCCRREWNRIAENQHEHATDPQELDEIPQDSFISDETNDSTEHQNPEQACRERVMAAARTILHQELAKMPQPLRDAILETEDCKSVSNPSARLRTGETAAIAAKYGYTPGAIRTHRNRLAKRARERFESEFPHD